MHVRGLLKRRGCLRQTSVFMGCGCKLPIAAALLFIVPFMTDVSADPLEAGAGAGPEAWVDNLDAIGASDWSYARAGHLLERAGFGGTPEEIEKLAAMTPQEAVSFLVDYESIDNGHLAPFLHSRDAEGRSLFDIVKAPIHLEIRNAINYATEHGEALGVKVDYSNPATRLQGVGSQGYFHVAATRFEMDRVVQWWGNQMLNTRRPLEEKMVVFWHGHFATGHKKVHDYRKMFNQLEMLREKATGNFRDLMVGIAKDPAMLRYLDNTDNVRGHPNENFAREIMELFSMGVGNYTEVDIREAARAFTGWSYHPTDETQFVVRPTLHDTGEKTVFGKTGNFDGEDIIDLILAHDATARFMAPKLYRFFVREDPSQEFEAALAARLREANYEFKPFLKMIFLSKDFYSPASYATQIKSPVHLIISTYRKLGLEEIPGSPNFRWTARALGQEPGDPPNVAGWKGGTTWINPATLLERGNFARRIFFPTPEPNLARRTYNFETRIGGQGGDAGAMMAATAGSRQDTASRGEAGSAGEPSGDRMGRQALSSQTEYNGWNLGQVIAVGNRRARDLVPPIPLTPANVDLVAMLKKAELQTVDGATDYIVRRFLRVELTRDRRQLVRDYFAGRVGSQRIDFGDSELETKLREVVHLVMSMAEYQIA